MASSGTAKRLGKTTPAVKPRALNASTPSAPTSTGHHGSGPVGLCAAVAPSSRPRHRTYAPSAQIASAAQEESRAAQRGSGVVATCSAVLRRPSREPVQAAAPATNGAKSTRGRPCWTYSSRVGQIAGSSMLLR